MNRLAARFFAILSLFFLMIGFVHCGAAGGGTPPIDIPTPVSHLSISSPNSDGLVTVTAEAGFADGGTKATITNISASSSVTTLFISTAWAQSVVTVTASFTGAFQTELQASAGDTLRLEYTSSGEPKTVDVIVPANQPQISTTFNILDVVVDPNTNEAFVIGNDGVDGTVFVLNLSTKQVTSTLPITGASGLFSAALDVDNDHALVIDSTNNNILHIHPDTVTVQSITPITAPVDVAIAPADVNTGLNENYGIVTHNDTTTAVSFFNSATNAVTANSGATGDNGETLQMCSFVETGDNEDSDIAVVNCLMSDDEYHLIIYAIDSSVPSLTQIQDIELTGITPGGISLFNTASEVLVTDINSDKVHRVIIGDGTITEITVGNGPQGVTVNNVDNKAFVVNNTDRTVSIIDLSDNSVSLFSDALGLNPTIIEGDRDTASSTNVVVNQDDGTVNLVSD